MLPAEGAWGQQYFGRRKYYWGLGQPIRDPAAELAVNWVGWAVLSPERDALLAKLAKAGWVTELETPDALLLRLP